MLRQLPSSNPAVSRIPGAASAELATVGLPAFAWSVTEEDVLAAIGAVGVATYLTAVVRRQPVAPGSTARSAIWIGAIAVGVAAAIAVAGRPAAVSLAIGVLVLGILLKMGTANVAIGGPLLAAGAAALLVGQGLLVPALALQAVAIPLLAAPDAAMRVHQVVTGSVRGVLRGLSLLVSTSMMALLSVPLVVLPWVVQRIARWDPTWRPHPPGSRLIPRAYGSSDPHRSWSRDMATAGVSAGRRVHRAAIVVGALGVLAVVLVAPTLARQPEYEGEHAATEGAHWWPEEARAQHLAFEEAAISGFLGPVLADVDTPHTHVADGIRRTWVPASEPVATVWMFGGSTLFGLGQRDDQTIPSAFAKAAAERGLPIRVVNHGVHGDVHWMQARRFAAARESFDNAPDLVVFYGGFNDLATVNYLNRGGSEALRENRLVGTLDTGSYLPSARSLSAASLLDLLPLPGRSDDALTEQAVVDFAVRQYDLAVRDTFAELDALGLPGAIVYQPSRITRSSPVPGEGDDSAGYRWMERQFRSRLPEGVIDLSDAFDSLSVPIYWDAAHTNELGAQKVAEALLVDLWPALQHLVSADQGA